MVNPLDMGILSHLTSFLKAQSQSVHKCLLLIYHPRLEGYKTAIQRTALEALTTITTLWAEYKHYIRLHGREVSHFAWRVEEVRKAFKRTLFIKLNLQ